MEHRFIQGAPAARERPCRDWILHYSSRASFSANQSPTAKNAIS